MQNLTLALIQTSLYWEDISSNLSMLEEKIWSIEEKVDIIILPEMFSTGFTMSSAELAEHPNMHTYRWMKQVAAQTNALIIGSHIVNDGGAFYNRLVWMQPDGKSLHYDKRHLFRMADEEKFYSPGSTRTVAEWKGWKILPLVCYDLRFPVWSRNTSTEGIMEFDLMIYVANWPAARASAWDTLLKARAIENLCYSVGVNRIGEDGNGIPFNGHSAVYNYKGDTLTYAAQIEHILVQEIDLQELQKYRTKFPAWKDADNFSIEY